MTKYGIEIMDDGKQIGVDTPKFSSDNGHLGVDLNADPKHFDIIHLLGTAMPIDSTPRYEVLLKIKHNKPFVPKVETYFYLDAANADAASIPSTNKYTDSFYKLFFPLINLGGPAVDVYVVSVDDTYLEFGHHSQHYLGGSLTSAANKIPAFAKYYIYNTRGFARRGELSPLN